MLFRHTTISAMISSLLFLVGCEPRVAETGQRAIATDLAGLYDVGGHSLYLECAGRGTPTLILDHGQGTDRKTWDSIWPELTQLSRTCRYDRAGRGESDRGPIPTSSRTIVENLNILLQRASVEPPFVLIGHSFGGLNAQLYTSVYPSQVKGLVLFDPSSRFYYPPSLIDTDLPFDESQQKEMRDFLTTFGADTYVASPEGVDWKRSYREAELVTDFGDMPLTVLTAGDRTWTAPDFFQSESKKWLADLWLAAQKQIVALSTYSNHIVVDGTGHFVHQDRPDIAVEAVEEILTIVRDLPN